MGDGFDLGLELVMDVRRRAEAAEHQCLDWPGGFTWWPGGVSQRVWAEPSFALEASPSWRVQVRSGFRTAFDGSPTHLSALTLDMTASALSAVVRDEDDRTRLELAATFHVHAGNLSWAGELVGFVAWLQAAEAKRLAGGQVGPGADDTLPADAGRGFPVPSPGWLDTPRWASGETSACVAQLASAPGVHAVSTPRGFAASFVLADQPGVGLALLEADTGAEWPGLGRGLSVALVAPGRAGVREALALNERETLLGWDTDLLGGWSARGEVLQHAAFFPDALYHEGLLTALVEDAVRRVDSVLRLGKPSA